MFGIGFPELIIILVVALIVFGPKKLPELARALGKGMAEFRKATHEIKESLDLNEDLQSVRKDIADSITGLDREAERAADEAAFKKATEEIKEGIHLNDDVTTGPDPAETLGPAEEPTEEAGLVGCDQPKDSPKMNEGETALEKKDDHVR